MAIRPRAAAIMRRPEADFQATRAAHTAMVGDAAAPDGVEAVIEAGLTA